MYRTAFTVLLVGLSVHIASGHDLRGGEAPDATGAIADRAHRLRAEVARARAEGYVVQALERLLDRSEAALRAGKSESARELLRRTTGMLISLKLPRWAHDMRFANPRLPDFQHTAPALRDTISLGRRWGEWYCVARPTAQAQEELDRWHRQGHRVVCYMEATLSPITMVLMPDLVNRANKLSLRYANNYWHHGEEWWGLSGTFATHRQWIADQVELLARMGFDGIELDSALSSPRFDARGAASDKQGGWVEMQQVVQRHPRFVFCPNVTGNPFIDDVVTKYNTVPMKEVIGSPAAWDDGPWPAGFGGRLRLTATRAYNVPIWGYFYFFSFFQKSGYELKPGGQSYLDLGYAGTIAHKLSPCSGYPGPSLRMQRFAHSYSDYVFFPTVEVFARQDRVKLLSAASHLRWSVARRPLLNGREELVIHLFKTNPAAGPIENVRLKIMRADAELPEQPRVTFISPGTEPQELNAAVPEAGALEVTVPAVPVWSVLVLGAPLSPQLTLAIPHESYVPGATIPVRVELAQRADRRANYTIRLQAPEGWSVAPERHEVSLAGKLTVPFRVSAPAGAAKGLYAITPLVTDQAGNGVAGWPKQIDVVPELSFRWKPAFVHAPSKRPQRVQLLVANNTAQAGEARVRLAFPEGWHSDRQAARLQLPPRGGGALELLVQSPDLDLWLWQFRDAYVEIDWQFGERAGATTLPLRAFPQLFYVVPGDPLGIFRTGGPWSGHKYRPWGWPQLKFWKADIEQAMPRLERDYVALWVDAETYARFKGRLAEFVRRGGGLVVTDTPIEEDDLLPVKLGTPGTANGLKLLPSPWTDSARRLRAEFTGTFRTTRITVKDWGRVIARWDDGSPATVVSRRPDRRVAFVASRLAGDYTFGAQVKPLGRSVFEQRWRGNLWPITAVYHELLRWAAGTGAAGVGPTARNGSAVRRHLAPRSPAGSGAGKERCPGHR